MGTPHTHKTTTLLGFSCFSFTARALTIFLALALLLGLSPGLTGTAQSAGTRDVFGMATHVAYKDYASAYGGDIERELDALQAAGARWVRLSMSWGWSESKKGQYDQDYLNQVESVVQKAQARGMKVLFVTDGSPYWANPNGVGYPPNDPRDYAVWLTYVVERYKQYSPAWEVWNEPNLGRFWGGAPNAAEYVALLKVSYAAIKAVDPDAIVVSAGLGQGGGALEPTQYLKDMYAAGAKGYFDKLGFHPYCAKYSPDTWWSDYPYGTFMVTERGIRPVMVANGDGDKQIWLTEMGYSTYLQADGSVGKYGVDEATQAAYLARAYEKVRDEWPFVDIMFWYNARNDGTDITSFGQNTGLMTFDYQAKPALVAYGQTSGGPTAPSTTTTNTTKQPTTTTAAPTTTTSQPQNAIGSTTTTRATSPTTTKPTTTTSPTTTTTKPLTTTMPTTTTTLQIPARILPVIQFLTPEDGAIVKAIVDVEVKASSPAGILKVELVADRVLVGADWSAPYAFTWDARRIVEGDHTLTAIAYDALGNVAGTAITVRSVSKADPKPTKKAISAASYTYKGGVASVFSTGVLYVE
jgi:hypothetical protein